MTIKKNEHQQRIETGIVSSKQIKVQEATPKKDSKIVELSSPINSIQPSKSRYQYPQTNQVHAHSKAYIM